MSLFVALVALLFLILLCYHAKRVLTLRKFSHLPGNSSLTSLPVVGHGYLLTGHQEMVDTLFAQQKKYGDIFRLDCGPTPTVMVGDYEDMLAMSKMEECLAKPYDDLVPFQEVRGMDKDGEIGGVFTCKGWTWRELRKFLVHNLKDLGLANDAIIGEEIDEFAGLLSEDVARGNNRRVIRDSFSVPINNVIWRGVTGEGSSQGDPRIIYLTRSMNEMFAGLGIVTHLQISYEFVYRFFKGLGLFHLSDYCAPLFQLVKEAVDASESDAEGSLIERFLAKMEENSNNPHSVFFGEKGRIHLHSTLVDLFIAGTETTTTALEWLMLYLVAYPDFQERIFQEIQSVTEGRPISLEDRPRCHLTLSSIDEVLRFCPELIFNVPHMTSADVNFRGKLFLPKGTQIVLANCLVHYSEKYFKDAKTFIPDRFLDSQGKYQPDEHVLAFGLGRRKCVGEALARAEFFLFFASIVQKFHLRLPEKQEPNFEWGRKVLSYPKPFEIVFTERNQQ